MDSLAACLRCIPVAAHLARISLDRSSCRRCCAAVGLGRGFSAEGRVWPFGVVEVDPLAQESPALEAVGKVVQIDSLLFEGAPHEAPPGGPSSYRPLCGW